MTDYNLTEVGCTKDVRGDNFPRGIQDWSFSIGRPFVWLPSRSYFRVTLSLTGPNGAVPQTKDCVALANDVCANLYNQASVKVAGNDISVVNTFLPQCSIIKKRMGMSKAWNDSVGRSATFLESDFSQRLARTASDAPRELKPRPVILPLAYEEKTVDQTLSQVTVLDGVVTGTNVNFTNVLGVAEGTILTNNDVYISINNIRFKVLSVTDSTHLVIKDGVNIPAVDGVGATNAYFIKQVPEYGDAKNTIQVIWTPPLGVWDMYSVETNDVFNAMLGSGDYKISLNPNPNYKTAAVESTRQGLENANPLKPPAPVSVNGTYFNVEVLDVRFYYATCRYIPPPDLAASRRLTFRELMIQSKPISGTGNTYQFSVPSSTQSLAVFFQSGAQGVNTLFPSTKFGLWKDGQNLLSGFQINYGNVLKPSSKWQSSYGLTNNELVQRYRDNLRENKLIENVGGTETFNDFLNNGLYILYHFQRDETDKSTDVQVSVDFRDNVEEGSSLYLVADYYRLFEIMTSDGAIVSVRANN